jgi:hypothetical protein
MLHKTILDDIVSNMKTTIDISDSLLQERSPLFTKRLLPVLLRLLKEEHHGRFLGHASMNFSKG